MLLQSVICRRKSLALWTFNNIRSGWCIGMELHRATGEIYWDWKQYASEVIFKENSEEEGIHRILENGAWTI